MLTPLNIITGEIAMKFEEKATRSPCNILRECVRLIHQGRLNRFTEERNKYCQGGGYNGQVISDLLLIQEGKRSIGGTGRQAQRHRDTWIQLTGCSLRDTRYESIRLHGRMPSYLTTGREYVLLARFRLENGETGLQRWRKDKTCKICGAAEDSLDHIMTACIPEAGGYKWALGETGRGMKYLQRIDRERKKEK